MSDTTLTIRVDAGLKAQFDSAARRSDLSSDQLLQDLMRQFIEQQQQAFDAHEAWFRDQVQAGRAAAQAGDLLSAEAVEADAQAWREQVRRSGSSGA